MIISVHMKLVLALMAMLLVVVASFSQSNNETKLRGTGKTSDGQWLIDGGLQSGDPKAPIKIEVYYDLQCPACARFQDVLGKAERRFKGKLFIVFRYFPLNIPAHDKAIMAARVVEAARSQGKGRAMLDMIFARQKLWSSDAKAKTKLFGYAKELGLNMPQFRSDYDDDATIRSIMNDAARASKLNLNSTPTVFLNDKELSFADALELEPTIAKIIH
jgi:protein-disulfide isomerase